MSKIERSYIKKLLSKIEELEQELNILNNEHKGKSGLVYEYETRIKELRSSLQDASNTISRRGKVN